MTFDPATTAARILAERKRLNLTREQAAGLCERLTKHGIRNLEDEADPKLSTLIELVTNVGMRLDAIAPELIKAKKR